MAKAQKISNHQKSAGGFGLLEVIISLAIITLVMGTIGRFYNQYFREKTRTNTRDVYLNIASSVEQKLQTVQNIYWSLLYPKNQPMRECIIGAGSGCTPTQTDFDARAKNFSCPNPFTLVDLQSSDRFLVLASPSLRYDRNGKPGCASSDPDCIFMVNTCFFATCPLSEAFATHAQNEFSDSRNPSTYFATPPPYCKYGAESIQVYYQISQVKGLKLSGQTYESQFKPYPSRPRFITLSVSQILERRQNPECNPGSALVGTTRSGKGQCRCQVPYVKDPVMPVDNQGRPLCNLLDLPDVCNPPLVYVGVDSDGRSLCGNGSEVYARQTDRFTSISDTRPVTHRAGCGFLGPNHYVSSFRRRCIFSCTVINPDQSVTTCDNFDSDNNQRTEDGYSISTGFLQGLVCDGSISCDHQNTN